MKKIMAALAVLLLTSAHAPIPPVLTSALTCGLDGPLQRFVASHYGCTMAEPPPVGPWQGYAEERPWPELWEGLPVERCYSSTGDAVARVVDWHVRGIGPVETISYACLVWLREREWVMTVEIHNCTFESEFQRDLAIYKRTRLICHLAIAGGLLGFSAFLICLSWL